MSNFNMFGKNNSSVSSSERTNNIKNKLIFNNHNPNINKSFKNHKYYENLKKGFIKCKEDNKHVIDNSACFQIWINNDSTNIKVNNVDDWNLSKIDYSGVNVNDTSLQDTSNSYWPYKKTSKNQKVLMYKDYSFLNTNVQNTYSKNFKHNLSRKSINL